MSSSALIRGSLVTLRPAQESDRRSIYEWMAESELTSSMMGPPHFPDAPVPTWEQFCDDYRPYFFDGSRPLAGRCFVIEAHGEPVGHLSYSEMDPVRGFAELDIWLRSEACCGRGYGSDAIGALTRHLSETFGITEFIMRPSRRNTRAIRAYARAGFVPLPLTYDQQAAMYGPGDYADAVVMQKKVACAG